MEADYTDTYTTVLRNTSRMTAKDLFRMMFVYYPKPVQGGDGFTDLIKEKDEGQVTFGKSDKHLEFQVLLQCDIPDAPTQCQSIRITTVVKYHNSLGKVYFFFIRPFHALICKWLLKRAARNWEKESTNIVK